MQALKSEGGFVWACKNYGTHLPMLTAMAQHLRCSQHILKGLLALHEEVAIGRPVPSQGLGSSPKSLRVKGVSTCGACKHA